MEKIKKVFSIIKVVSLLGFFIAIGAITSVFTIIFFAPSRQEVIVPNVIGKDFASAFEILSTNKLDIKKVSEYHDTIPKDFVISQTPSPGKKIKEGRRIWLVVSSGREVFEMPDLRNCTVREAQERLYRISKGLRIVTTSFVHTNFPKGCIIAQAPLPFSKIEKGDVISVLVSHGPHPKSFLMPEFIGMNWQYVNREIERLGLIIEDVVEKVDYNVEEGIVLEQNPPFGFKVRKGDYVNLVISKHEEKLDD
ncbi:MAG: PASTA domain-containing protein [bacterium]|nr:PASTA domain-containing protein [bacterium]